MRSISEVAKVMGKRTIAEYAENPEILERLAEIGVDYTQGWRIAMARPLRQLEKID